jgi:phenylacetate-coenzyme A ligase PaaK-like adenylate-forming protein
VPEVSTPSAEYQIVRGVAPPDALHVRLEYDAAAGADARDLARRLEERFRERLGVRAELDLVARGAVPRFAYKAARVVDA